jgi:hypothetical protein
MPWSGSSFKDKHNHSASASEAAGAARQANAIAEKTGNEGMALAVANKTINKRRRQVGRIMKRGVISDKAAGKHLGKYGGQDQQPIDAASR